MLAYVLMPLRTESGTILVNCEENNGIYTGDPSGDKVLSATERYLKVREENPDSTDLIRKTMGLSPLGPFNSVCGQNQTVTEHSAVEQQHHQ